MYADVLFVLNFMMDLMVLLAAGWIPARTSGFVPEWKRFLLGAFLGAVGGSVLTILAGVYGIRQLQEGLGAVAAGLLLCAVMVKTAFCPRSRWAWIQRMVSVYGITFLFGGMLGWLQANMRLSAYFAAVTVCFFLFCTGQLLFVRAKGRTQTLCTVSIQTEAKTVSLKGLFDTGNLLSMPGTQTPVSVVWADAVMPGLSTLQRQQYTYIKEHHGLPEEGGGEWHLIPYHSVGSAGGLLPVLAVPRMYIRAEQREVLVVKGFLGLCPHRLSGTDAYQIIVNPKLMDSPK